VAKPSNAPERSAVVVGDSTSCTLLPGLEAVGPSFGLRFENGAVVGCGIVSGETAPYFANGFNYAAYTAKCQGEANSVETQAIERYRPSLILWGSTDEKSSIVVGGKVLDAGSPAWKAVMLERMDKRVEQFVATGARVVLLLEPPSVDVGTKPKLTPSDRAYEQMNALLKEVAARHPHDVAAVDLEARVCPGGPPCPYVVDGFGTSGATVAQAVSRTIRPDTLHYGPASALWVSRWLVPRIEAAAKNL